MSDDNDGLTPEFESKNVPKEIENKNESEIIDNVPDMVKEDHPDLYAKPGWDTSEQDEEFFAHKWQKQNEKYNQTEIFDHVDKDAEQATSFERDDKNQDVFDRIDDGKKWSDRLSRDRGNERE